MALLDFLLENPPGQVDPAIAHKVALSDFLARSGLDIGQSMPSQSSAQPAGANAQDQMFVPFGALPTRQVQDAPVSGDPYTLGELPTRQVQDYPVAGTPYSQTVTKTPAPQTMSMQQKTSDASPYPVTLGDRLSALGRGYENGGLLGGIGDAISGIDRQNQMMNATYSALINKGIDPTTAKAAVGNPEVLKQILPLVFPPKAPAVEKIGPDDRLVEQTRDQSGQIVTRDITPGGGQPSGKTPQGRAQLATQYGLQPGTVEYNAFVLNGKLPDVTPDHAAIKEADNQVMTTNQLINDLQYAKQLSSQAYDGAGAGVRSTIVNNIPFAGHEGSYATTNLDNVVQNSILPGLKSIFPGRVTNTDLLLMKDLQGASNQPQAVRDAIYDRAITRAQQLQQEKQAAASALRNGTYYKPGGATVQPQAQSQSPVSLSFKGQQMPVLQTNAGALNEARAAIARGAPRDAVMQRLQQNGIDATGL